MAEPTSCCLLSGGYCARVDTLFNMPGVHVLDVAWREPTKRCPAGLRLLVESAPAETGCPGCGVIAVGHGRRLRRLHDIPAFSTPVELVWRQRRYRCLEPACPVGGFNEDHPLAGPRAKLTTRACWWAISCIQRDTASVAAAARRLGVDWHTVWDAIAPLLTELAGDPDRLTGVDTLGVDEHIWHHRPRPRKGPKELTGIVDLTRRNGRPKARLLDLVPGRSGKAYADWLTARGEPFTAGVEVATLDPFRGYAVRHEARVIRVGWKDPLPGCRSSPVKLRAAGPVEVRRLGGKQPLTTPGRSSTARWAGSGKRGRQGVTGVNRWLKPLKLWNRLESGGSGPGSSAHRPTRVGR